MKVRKAINRIMALGTGAAMMGATMFGAMAADLSDYPSPLFIKDGVFDGLLVVGDNAAAEDIIGVTNIAMSLQSAAVVTKEVSTGSATAVTVEGDSVKIAEATNLLEMGEEVDSIRTSVTSSDLSALADGSISNEHGDFDYTQVIELPAVAKVEFTQDPDDDSEAVKDYLKFDQNQVAYKYKVSFTPALKSDHHAAGSSYLNDIRDKKITLLGKQYTILRADHDATSDVALTFMAGAVTDIMSEGATKTYTLAGKDYEVTASYIGATNVLLTINGEVTDKLAETETYRLTDGVEVGINTILAQNVAGEAQGDQVEFSLGAEKIKLDDSATNATGSCTVTIGVDTSTNVKCDIVTSSDAGTAAGADVLISSFEVYYNTTDNLYVPAGGSTSEVADAEEDESGVFFLQAFDIKYEGLTEDRLEDIKLRSSGTNNYKLAFTNKAGVSYNEFVWGVASGGTLAQLGKRVGTSIRDLVINETEQIAKNEYFVVNKNKYSRILQYTDINPTDNVVKVKDLGSGSVHEVTYSSLTGNLILDGNTYQINVSVDSSSAAIYVDMNGDADVTDQNGGNTIYTENEAYIGLAHASNESLFNITTPEDEDNNRNTVVVEFEVNADSEADIESVTSSTQSDLLDTEQGSSTYINEDYVYNGTSGNQFGMFVQWDKKGSGAVQTELSFKVGKTATVGNVFVTSGVTTAATAAAETVTTEEVQKIDVGAVKLASEVADPSASNLILVGGPCANSVARTVMGVTSANCAEGFEAGKAMIKLYDHAEGKVAMVVAGAGAVDTRRAALVVANYQDYADDLVGDEVVVTTVTSTPTVAQPVVAEAGEGEAEAEGE